jgi:hypothetical protein
VSTLKRNRRISPPTLPKIVAAAGVAIAIAAGAAAVTSNRADHTQAITITHAHTQSPYLPAIQEPGTGQAHIVLDPRTGQAHGTIAPPTNPTNATPNNPDNSNVGHRAEP